jgi:hypothetical protein
MAASNRVLVGVAALLAFGAAACDALLGFGKYKDCTAVDCADASSDVFGDGTAAADADAGDSAADVDSLFDEAGDGASSSSEDASDGGGGLLDGPGSGDGVAGPVNAWARWPMPNPDASIGGDSSATLPHAMVYDAGEGGAGGTVFDTVTGLTWQQDGSHAAMSESDAVSYCTTQNMRLPTRIELVSLVDFTQHPTINPTTFTGTKNYYWTSSPVAGDAASLYWTVDFTDGLVHNNATGNYVRCVRGGSP